MSIQEKKEYAERLKSSAKELIDGIGTDSGFEQNTVKMIYGFVRRSFLECRAQKGGAA
jgi:hypothetical protein